MAISVFDIFTVGIGPSSSHTVGPMRAACRFVHQLKGRGLLQQTASVVVGLYGSLGSTGKGHGSDRAVLMGLEGEDPELIDPETMPARVATIDASSSLALLGQHRIDFPVGRCLKFQAAQSLPHHPNGMCFRAYDKPISEVDEGESPILERVYYSVGGGFVVDEGTAEEDRLSADSTVLPHPFSTGDALLEICSQTGGSISQVMLDNERVWRTEQDIRQKLLDIWNTMRGCVERGCRNEGVLPGGLQVKRRAPGVYQSLVSKLEKSLGDPLSILDWVNLYALAVNEENAAGGRIVTAPTNGAAGIIPAVLHYYERFSPTSNEDGIVDFLLTAGAIAILYKENASISGAEVGCQGEVGVACSMAAGGLVEAMGGTPSQVENAAEIGMEHNLGLTCDPVGGRVQIPCIERNAMGAVKAINAARMAMQGDGKHHVSLDKVIATMRQTGADMSSRYKETSRGGLAVNIIEC